uniref:Apoptosis facilitator Bcl-2-like protein 14 n=1 Tax=Cyprinus carpio TaxID=7962 RepID=A0A8C2AIB1_CYPCA
MTRQIGSAHSAYIHVLKLLSVWSHQTQHGVMDQKHSDGDVQTPAADSLEFKLLMAYARKRRPTDTRLPQDVPSSPQLPEEHGIAKKNKRKKRLLSLLKCIKPQTDDVRARKPAAFDVSGDRKVEKMENLVGELTEISASVHFTSCEIEADGPEDEESDFARKLAELLREQGDELNEKIKADKVLLEILRSSLSYSFFMKVMEAFCGSVSPDMPSEQKDKKVNVALVCEATSQLVGIHYHPVTYVMGLGARYLQEKYSTWINKNMDVGNGEADDESKDEVQ